VDSLRYFTADLGSGNFDVIDSVITGYATGIGGGFNATAGTHWTTATNAATFCNFFNNTTDVDSNITTGVSDNITTDPEIGAANTTVKSDYAVAATSPCVGAGSAGGDIGFQA
jgi:hypothetical protein